MSLNAEKIWFLIKLFRSLYLNTQKIWMLIKIVWGHVFEQAEDANF